MDLRARAKTTVSRIAVAIALSIAAAAGTTAQPPGGPPSGGQPGGPPPGGQPPGGRGGPPPTGRATAPVDLTGYWVAIVSEDWTSRMVTPAKSDFAGIPLNVEGRRTAATWDLDADNANGNQCRAFGAAGLMRLPLRLHITWRDDNTLAIETDAGQQVRLLRFGAAAAPGGERSWQGESVARWRRQTRQGRGGTNAPAATGGTLAVDTTRMRAGYLRKNGIPYSEDARLTEFYNRHSGPGDLQWLTITTIVEDPKYLTQRFITSSSFKREPDGSKWHPTPCATAPPTKKTRTDAQ